MAAAAAAGPRRCGEARRNTLEPLLRDREITKFLKSSV